MSVTITETTAALPETKEKQRRGGNGKTKVKASDRFSSVEFEKAKDRFAKSFKTGKHADKEIHRSNATLRKSDKKRARKSAPGLTTRLTRVTRAARNVVQQDFFKKLFDQVVGYSDFQFQKEALQLLTCFTDRVGQEARDEMADRATNPHTGKVRRIRLHDVKGAFRKYNV